MTLCDVNVYLFALVENSEFHSPCRHIVERMTAEANYAYSDLVLSAVVRIATHKKVFSPPVEQSTALDFFDAVRDASNAVRVQPGARHWRLFRDLMVQHAIVGSDVTDAYLAALSMEHGCQWISCDNGFSRFTSLDFLNATTL